MVWFAFDRNISHLNETTSNVFLYVTKVVCIKLKCITFHLNNKIIVDIVDIALPDYTDGNRKCMWIVPVFQKYFTKVKF